MIKLRLMIFLFSVMSTLGFIYKSSDLKEKILFADVKTAKKLLTSEDQFTENWSQFDINSRLRKKNGTKSELFEYISSQARDWTEQEKIRLMNVISAISLKIDSQKFKLNFPSEIIFVKTTGEEEGGAAGYTRSNYIVLKEEILKISDINLEKLIVHELFHILSRNDPGFKKEMYQMISFKLCNDVDYPEQIANMRITNPDAPKNDSYITLEKDGVPVDCMMILYSEKEYDGGEFFNYLKTGLLKVGGEEIKSIEMENGHPVIFNFKEVTKFFEQVGENTKYIIHPEEVLADNFVFAADNKRDLPSQWLVEKIQKKLSE